MIVPFIFLGIALGFFIGAIATHADARRRAQIPADEFREKWKGIGYTLGYGAKEKEIADQLLEEQIRKDKENEESKYEECAYDEEHAGCNHCDCNVCCHCGYDYE